tara:strand:+ start:717 stop:1607 length:891 start_codon:yes stop_codon:yes gene_type:complete
MSLKIGVLMGGNSDERIISLSTGNEVLKALKKLGYQAEKILIKDNFENFLEKFQEQELIFNALHGGEGEDGKIQQWMDDNNIKYTGSGPTSSALCMDKNRSKDFAKIMGVRTPKWQLFSNPDEKIKLQFPFVVKPNTQGSTFGLTVVNNEEELPLAIKTAFQYGEDVIAEEYIKGREVTVPILGESLYPILEIVPSHDLYDFDCKYTPGMTEYFCPAELGSDITSLINENTELLFKEFGCNVYARVDYLIDNSGIPYFLEVNTLPGMTSTSLLPKSLASAGISFESLIAKIVKLSM